jgi:hypothetical protein
MAITPMERRPGMRAAAGLSPFCLTFAASALLQACGGGGSSPLALQAEAAGQGQTPTQAQAPTEAATALACNESLKTAFKPDANTTVTFVKAFKQGEPLALSGTPASPAPPLASCDVCVVKLNVGPGNPGPADAPSTSPGIGIEVWLPTPERWNGRNRSVGDGGYAGSPVVSSLTALRSDIAGWATHRRYVSSISDNGHANQDGVSAGAFAMNPDGSVNTALWKDLSTRSLHEQAEKTKALSAAYYGKAPDFSYYAGCSGGGRLGYASAQSHPGDFDGILVEAPSIDQTQFFLSDMWPGFVTQRDLGGVSLTQGQADLISKASIAACDTALNGTHDGYLSDPSQCNYDPSTDPAVLCVADGGTNASSSCLSKVQAVAANKMWYGPTSTGTAPSPAVDNGYGIARAADHLWWGIPRGIDVNSTFRMKDVIPGLFDLVVAQLALSLQDPALATVTPLFKNASGNGEDRWKDLSYADFANAMALGKLMDPIFGNIDTNNPDLTGFRDAGGKMITLQGFADALVRTPRTEEYYNQSAAIVGGFDKAQQFHRLYLEPGRGHCDSPAFGLPPGSNPPKLRQGNPGPDSERSELFDALVAWVEKDKAPTTFTATTLDNKNSRPVCLYPDRITYMGGDTNLASSYSCK